MNKPVVESLTSRMGLNLQLNFPVRPLTLKVPFVGPQHQSMHCDLLIEKDISLQASELRILTLEQIHAKNVARSANTKIRKDMTTIAQAMRSWLESQKNIELLPLIPKNQR